MERIREEFDTKLSPRWSSHLVGSGSIQYSSTSARFTLEHASRHTYSNAQIDDYQDLARRQFLWRPPLTLEVRARFSHSEALFRGTAGFGFWNDPFLMTGRRLPTLPQNLWFFFASPPSDIKLDLLTPGCGWKAASLNSRRLQAMAWAPTAPLLMALMRVPAFYRRLWPPIQRALGVGECHIPCDMADWHTYRLEWRLQCACFWVAHSGSEHLVLETQSPSGPLGFVMWVDNQYLVATPWGRLRWGILDVPETQWLEVDYLAIEPG